LKKRVSKLDTSLESKRGGTAWLYQLYIYSLDKGDAERNKQQPGEKRETDVAQFFTLFSSSFSHKKGQLSLST